MFLLVMAQGLGRVWGLGLRVLGFRVEGLGFRGEGLALEWIHSLIGCRSVQD